MASLASSMQALERFNRDVEANQTKFDDLRIEFEDLRIEFEAIRIQHEADLKAYESARIEFDEAHKDFLEHAGHYYTQLNDFNEKINKWTLNFNYNELRSQNMMDACKGAYEHHRQIFQEYQSYFDDYEKSFLRSKWDFEDLRSTVEYLNKRYWPHSNQINVGIQVAPDQINVGIQVYPEDCFEDEESELDDLAQE